MGIHHGVFDEQQKCLDAGYFTRLQDVLGMLERGIHMTDGI
jgi:hypothetical protein